MLDYRELGNKYLNQNKRRVIITVVACAIVAASCNRNDEKKPY